MKAILVIDVPTESLENVIASVNICEQREGYNIILKRMGKMCLKPMPQEREPSSCITESIVYAQGWNDCLREITDEATD